MSTKTHPERSAAGAVSTFGAGTAAPWAAGGTGQGSFAQLRSSSAASQRSKQEEARLTEELVNDPYAGMTKKERRAAERQVRRLKGEFSDYPHLLAIKPREGYAFRSDYFTIDNTHACILGFFHDESADDDFGAFWGVDRIPAGLGDKVSVVVFEQLRRMGKTWVEDRLSSAETLERLDDKEQSQGGTKRTRTRAAKTSYDLDEVADHLRNGASYLHVHNRLLVKAPTLVDLDEAVERIRRLYIDRFGTLEIAPYHGEQRKELSTLFRKNDKKRGRGFHFTSVEFAGSHSLVTNGLNDPTGEYVGSMLGDVNNSAVLFDVNDYEHHVVVADSAVNNLLGRAHVPDTWGSKISQSALLNNGRVVHLVLDGADLDVLGPKLSGITARLDMSRGDINMFEMFGNREDELAIFPAHLEKLVLMAEQAYETTENDRSIIRGSLKETLTTFYIDKQMWARNAKSNRDRLRLVDLDHQHVPRLQDLVSYFDTKYKELSNSTARDDEALHAYSVLRLVFTDLLDNNGSVFNTHTSDEIDGVVQARRVVYDYSRLLRSGKGVAMAQLVNTVGFAVENLGPGDTVIIHGTEHVDSAVKPYIDSQLAHLFNRGGRVAYLYNDVDKMLEDEKFNRFHRADWTILGSMTEATVADYQKRLVQDIPPDLEQLVTSKSPNLAYLRRGVTNVVFHVDLALGVNPARAAQRAIAERKVAERLRGATSPDRTTAARKAPVTNRKAGVPRPEAGARRLPATSPTKSLTEPPLRMTPRR